jgi:hypothetical protein
MAAFFRNTTQAAMDGNILHTKPSIRVYSDQAQQRKAELESKIVVVRDELKAVIDRYAAARPKESDAFEWIAKEALELRTAVDAVVVDASTSTELGDYGRFEEGTPFTLSFWVKPSDKRSIKNPLELFSRYDRKNGNLGWRVSLEKGMDIMMKFESPGQGAEASRILRFTGSEKLQPKVWNHVLITYDGTHKGDQYIANYSAAFTMRVNNKPCRLRGLNYNSQFGGQKTPDSPLLLLGSSAPSKAPKGAVEIRDLRIFTTLLSPSEQLFLAFTNATPAIQSDPEKKGAGISPLLKVDRLKPRMDQLRQDYNELKQIEYQSPITLVMEEKNNSEPFAHILLRGAYDNLGERVTAGVPEVLPP